MIDSFSNNPLSTDTLPTVKGLDYQYLSPHYVKVAVIQLLLAMVLPLAAIALMLSLVMANQDADQTITITVGWLIIAGVVFVGFLLLVIWLCIKEAKIKAYCLREHDLVFSHGLFFKKIVVQPLLRVQHVEVSQNPLESRWNLATLKLYSAGGFRYTFAIPGLEKPVAERIHQYVVDYQEARHE